MSPQPARAAETSEIPIVILFVADPVGLGLASALARPGGDLTGVATLVPGGFAGKPLGILRALGKAGGNFINPSNEIHRLNFPTNCGRRSACNSTLSRCAKLRKFLAIVTAKAGGAEALYIAGDPILNSQRARCPNLLHRQGLRSIYLAGSREVEAGGLFLSAPDYAALARRGARYVDRILKGAKPADLPIEQPHQISASH